MSSSASDSELCPIPWTLPLKELGWLNTPRLQALEKLGLRTVDDLLHHFPHRHEDRREFAGFPREASETPVCLCGTVSKVSASRFPPGMKRVEITLDEEGDHALCGQVVCRWFNLHYIQKMVSIGQRLVVFGKPKRSGKRIVIDHPEFEILEEGDEQIHLLRLTPIYPATGGVTSKMLRGWIHRLLREGARAEISPLPPTLQGMPYGQAIRAYHFPENWEDRFTARRELVLAEFFRLQLLIHGKRRELGARPGAVHAGPGHLLEAFLRDLPFTLTGAQHRAIEAIRADLAAEQPMNRLLQGDVGSGKTVVALAAMLLVVEAGHPALLMAPTQLLAEQHYLLFRRWLAPLNLRVALRTGTRKETHALPLFDGPEEEPQIVVGTHALLFETGTQRPPGLVVIDEQHRFGVIQRGALQEGEVAPDLLIMSATPIPRTWALTVHGDLDTSILDERPAGRGRIRTFTRGPEKLPEILAFIRQQLEAGRQAYVVYPLVDESDKTAAKAATAEYDKWREAFAPFHVELLHGRIGPEEKEAIMERFRNNKSQVLVATTVIEVGIDVANATVMLIENAERFGLAQLHQLRGRVGRGAATSYCILIHQAETPEAKEKMRVIESTTDGFIIAEEDFRLRGPGDLLGALQSGRLPGIRLGDLLADLELMQVARKAAATLFNEDPSLDRAENALFRRELERNREQVLARIS